MNPLKIIVLLVVGTWVMFIAGVQVGASGSDKNDEPVGLILPCLATFVLIVAFIVYP